ncbi:MAG: SUMF1/EgtB/PvdO family nonheme iron enzyme [Chloroflexota bacterium]
MTDFDIAVCRIPAGEYVIGDNAIGYSRPEHPVQIAAFAIGQTTVTNAQFLPFIEAGGYATQDLWSEMGWRWLRERTDERPAFLDDENFNAPDQPVVGVTWYEADAYTRWLARETGLAWRLPTEAEWEVAALGQDRIAPRPRNYNTVERRIGHPWPVTEAGNVSWCGAWDMCGNVWEWCSTRWGRNYESRDYLYPYTVEDGRENLSGSYARVIRGGSWYDPIEQANPANRARYLPGSRASNIGFRLARSESDDDTPVYEL